MKTTMFRTAALALAVPGMAMAVPAAAAPAARSEAYNNSAVGGDHAVQKNRKHYRNYERYNINYIFRAAKTGCYWERTAGRRRCGGARLCRGVPLLGRSLPGPG